MLKYACMLNGVTDLIMMKADVLNQFETISVCTKYNVNDEITEQIPFDITFTNNTSIISI